MSSHRGYTLSFNWRVQSRKKRLCEWEKEWELVNRHSLLNKRWGRKAARWRHFSANLSGINKKRRRREGGGNGCTIVHQTWRNRDREERTETKEKLTDIDFSHWGGNKVGSDSRGNKKTPILTDSHSSSRLSFIGYFDRRPGVRFFNQARASFKEALERSHVSQWAAR